MAAQHLEDAPASLPVPASIHALLAARLATGLDPVRGPGVVVEKRRQALLEAIAAEYSLLVDELRGRVRAHVTVAREADPALQKDIVASLEKL